jgi:hypothetical protein
MNQVLVEYRQEKVKLSSEGSQASVFSLKVGPNGP